MEASWKGGCCGEEVVAVAGSQEFSRRPLPNPIPTQCKKCGCWYRLYSVVGAKGYLKLSPEEAKYNFPAEERQRWYKAVLNKQKIKY